MRRCRDTLASWQRPGIGRRLDEFAATHPETDVQPLREALLSNGDDASPGTEETADPPVDP